MEHLSHKQKMTIMIAIMSAMFFAAINQTIVSTAMPRISAILNGMDLYTWVITIYLLTSTIATVLVGKLSDIYGRKPFLLSGIIFFIVGAFLCGTSINITQMIIYRGIQGVGGGIIMASPITAVGDLFAPRERAKWTGMLMAIFGFSSVIGPALGGWMVDHMDWEWVSIQTLGLFGAFAISLVIFILVERKVQSSVLPLSLFRNSIVTISNLSGFLMNAGMMGALMYLPFYIQGCRESHPHTPAMLPCRCRLV